MRPSIRENDPKLRIEMRREFSNTILPRWLRFLEKLIKDNGNTGFFVGDSITIADLAAWRLCGWISGGIIDGIPKDILALFPHILTHQIKINNLPKVVEWEKRFKQKIVS